MIYPGYYSYYSDDLSCSTNENQNQQPFPWRAKASAKKGTVEWQPIGVTAVAAMDKLVPKVLSDGSPLGGRKVLGDAMRVAAGHGQQIYGMMRVAWMLGWLLLVMFVVSFLGAEVTGCFWCSELTKHICWK